MECEIRWFPSQGEPQGLNAYEIRHGIRIAGDQAEKLDPGAFVIANSPILHFPKIPLTADRALAVSGGSVFSLASRIARSQSPSFSVTVVRKMR
jgi:hypothetical protein